MLALYRQRDLAGAAVAQRWFRLETAHDDFGQVSRDSRVDLARVAWLASQNARNKLERRLRFMRQVPRQHLVGDETEGV